MEISIRSDLQKFLEQQLNAGHHSSVDELVNAALAHLQHKLESPFEVDEELKREVALGVDELDRGEVEKWNPEFLREEVERRHAAETKPAGKRAS